MVVPARVRGLKPFFFIIREIEPSSGLRVVVIQQEEMLIEISINCQWEHAMSRISTCRWQLAVVDDDDDALDRLARDDDLAQLGRARAEAFGGPATTLLQRPAAADPGRANSFTAIRLYKRPPSEINPAAPRCAGLR